MPTAPTPIPAFPSPPPTTDDPVNFDARADDTVEWLDTAMPAIDDAAQVTYDNAVEAAASAVLAVTAADTATSITALMATSSTPIPMTPSTTTSVTLDGVSADIDFADGEVLVAKRLGDPNTMLVGEVDNRVGLVFDFIVGVNGVIGTGGPYDDWAFTSGRFYQSGATKAQYLAQVLASVAVTPLVIREGKEWAALTDGATVTPNGLNGRNFTWTIGGNRTLGAITNCAVNDIFRLWITQDATGGRVMVWASGVYLRVGGLPILPTAAGAKAHLELRVLAVDGSGTATSVLATFASNPTNA